jgi:endonuclease/exonuclease/phosphatase family metal-dependent hydrolase
LNKGKIRIVLSVFIFLCGFGARSFAFEANDPGDLMETIHLKVLTLNIHSGINWSGKYDLDAIVKFIGEVNPDLIGLQEVDRCWSSMSQFQDLPGELALRLRMFSSYSVSLARNNGYFGNLVLSKHPITVMWAEQLPGSLERRSFVFTQVLINGIRINFVTAHLGLSDSDRLQQAATMLRLTRQISGPLIVTGDFNADASDGAVKMIKESFIDIQELSGLKQGTFRLRDGKIGPLIDYILVTPEFGFVDFQIVDNYISDHLPVMAELSLMVDRAKTD